MSLAGAEGWLSGDRLVPAGGVDVGLPVDCWLTSGGLATDAGGLAADAGGLTADAGELVADAGGLTVDADGLPVDGFVDAAGGMDAEEWVGDSHS